METHGNYACELLLKAFVKTMDLHNHMCIGLCMLDVTSRYVAFCCATWKCQQACWIS